jgi:hypothetical protein
MILHEEYSRLAKSVDYVSDDQAKQIIGIVLDKLKDHLGAVIVDVWLRTPGGGGVDILMNYLRRCDPLTPPPQPIAITESATGLLVWIAEERKPVWLDDIPAHAKSGVNRLTDQVIEGRYFNLYDRTRAFAGFPIEYRGQGCAILTAETAVVGRIKSFHIDLMKILSEPTGILIWKGGVFEEMRKHTNEAINDFRNSKVFGPLNPYRTGFIARPFEDRFDLMSKAVEKIFQNQRIRATVYRPAPGGRLIVDEMMTQIDSSHFGIADITSLNDNVLIEVGAMLAARKPLIVMRNRSDENTPLPFDIAGRQCYLYEAEGEEIVICDANTRRSLQEFVSEFIHNSLLAERLFQEAREWLES